MSEKPVRLEITLSPEQSARLDRARGLAGRATYVKAALDQKLALELEPRAVPPPAAPTGRRKPSISETWAR